VPKIGDILKAQEHDAQGRFASTGTLERVYPHMQHQGDECPDCEGTGRVKGEDDGDEVSCPTCGDNDADKSVKAGDLLKDQSRDADGKFTSTGASTKADIDAHRAMVTNLHLKHTAMGTKHPTPEQQDELNGHYRKLQEMLDSRSDAEKSRAAGDLQKTKDASGHEHDKAGLFTSVGGSKVSIDASSGKGSVQTAAGNHYDVRPQKDGHSVHAGDKQVGEVKQAGAAHQARAVADNGKKSFHGNFTSAHGAAAALAEKHEYENKGKKAELPGEKIEREHTNPKTRATDSDASVADRKRQGDLSPASTLKRKAIFMIGGGGVGKGGVVEHDYTGNEGKTHTREDGTEETIKPGHEKYIAPQPGFENAPVFDSDAEKKLNPLFTHEVDEKGMFGPSGPKSFSELQQYPPDMQEALDRHIQRQTGFRDARDFANHVIKDPYEKGHPNEGKPRNEDGRGEDFGGGITHEISSHVVKERLQNALRNKDHGSFIYDSTGSDKYKDWAHQAMENGYDVEFHHADAPREVAHMRNAHRERTVPEHLLNGTHDKVGKILPGLKEFAEKGHAAGLPIDFKTTKTYKDHDLARARQLGFTETGAAPGYVAPKNAKKKADAKAG
jgi:hypothetical protein